MISVIAQNLIVHLKTSNASNSKVLFCDLVIFSSKLLVFDKFSS